MELVDERIWIFKNDDTCKQDSQDLKVAGCSKALKDVHDNFVVTPIDKTTSSIAVICKQYYASLFEWAWTGW